MEHILTMEPAMPETFKIKYIPIYLPCFSTYFRGFTVLDIL